MTPSAAPDPTAAGSRILFVHAGAGEAQRYRCVHPAQQLRQLGLQSGLVRFDAPDFADRALRSDVVILHRIPIDRSLERTLRLLRRQGTLLVFDTDDLVFDPTALAWVRALESASPARRLVYREEVLRYRRTAECCDALLVSTPFLAEQARSLNKPVWVHRNAVSPEMIRLSATPRRPAEGERPVAIGYASGTPTHDRDFGCVLPILIPLLEKHPAVELWLLGPVDPGPLPPALEGRIRRFPLRPWWELPALLARLDINLAPLEPGNPFCDSKSEIKVLEAGLVRVPTIASRSPAYTSAVRSGVDGLLASHPEEWREALETLVAKPALRQALGDEAHSTVLRDFSPAARAPELLATLRKIRAGVPGGSAGSPGGNEAPNDSASDPASLLFQLYEPPPSRIRKLAYFLRGATVRDLGLKTLFHASRVLGYESSGPAPTPREESPASVRRALEALLHTLPAASDQPPASEARGGTPAP